MSCQKSIVNFSPVKKFIGKYNTQIKKFGPQKTMLKFLKSRGNKFIIEKQSPKTDKVLKREPVVIIANHPFEIEPAVLMASLPSRKDSYLIIDAVYTNVFTQLDSCLIPVYIQNKVIAERGKGIKEAIWHKLHPLPKFTREEEHKKNINSIRKASRKVTQGGSVAIFPSGPKNTSVWHPGVGYLVKGISAGNSFFLVKAMIKGTSYLEFLRFLPKIGNLFPSFKVVFSAPKKINYLLDFSPREITYRLKKEYIDWQAEIESA